jgi:hypothetical protein
MTLSPVTVRVGVQLFPAIFVVYCPMILEVAGVVMSCALYKMQTSVSEISSKLIEETTWCIVRCRCLTKSLLNTASIFDRKMIDSWCKSLLKKA